MCAESEFEHVLTVNMSFIYHQVEYIYGAAKSETTLKICDAKSVFYKSLCFSLTLPSI